MLRRFLSHARAYPNPGWATLILVGALLGATAAQADGVWKVGEDCDSATARVPRRADDGVSARIGTDTRVSWCPTNTTASEAIETECHIQCSWDDGGTGSDLTITNTRNDVTRWLVPSDTPCDSVTTPTGPCSDFTMNAGEKFTVAQSVSTNASKLICWHKGQCLP